MEKIRISLMLLLMCLTASQLKAQEYKIAVQNNKDGMLILKDFKGDLPIEGYSGNEIIFVMNSEDQILPEKAKGLKAIYPGGTDNTGIGLAVEKKDKEVTVTCLIPFTKKSDYKIKVPDNISLVMESGCENSSRISISNMKNELDVNNCHDIELKNVSGPLVLSTIAGDIDITFGSINSDKPFSINSISGNIDITLPAKTATDLEVRTISGSFYSDFDFKQTQSNLKKVGGNETNYQLNGGGFKFSIVTVSGNIYLRKGN